MFQWWRLRQTASEQLATSLCYEQRVFKLSRALSVNSRRSPFVFPSKILETTLVYHWFNCKYMSNFHKAHRLAVSVMRYLRCHVESCSNSMSSVASDY